LQNNLIVTSFFDLMILKFNLGSKISLKNQPLVLKGCEVDHEKGLMSG